MLEFIGNVLPYVVMMEVVYYGYKTITELIPEYRQYLREEKMTIEERMALRKARGEEI